MRIIHFIALLIFPALMLGGVLYLNGESETKLDTKDVYELVSSSEHTRISNGELNLESGDLLAIKNIHRFIGGDFSISFLMDYRDKYGFFIGFEDAAGNRNGLDVERDDPDFAPMNDYMIDVRSKKNQIDLWVNGVVYTFWPRTDLTDSRFVIDGKISTVFLNFIQVEKVVDGKRIVSFRDDFDRKDNRRWYWALIYGAVCFFVVLAVFFVEAFVLRKKEEAGPKSHRLSLLFSFWTMALCAWFGYKIPGFRWVSAGGIPPLAFIFLRLRFVFSRHGFLNLAGPSGGLRVLSLIFLLPGAIYLVVVGAYSMNHENMLPLGQTAWAGGMVVALFFLSPLLLARLTNDGRFRRSLSLFAGTSFVYALLGYLMLFGHSQWVLNALPVLFPIGTLIYMLPIRANIKAVTHPNLLLLFAALLSLVSIEFALRSGAGQAHFRPMNMGKAYETNDLLFWVPRGFFPEGNDFNTRAPITIEKVRFRSGMVPLEKPADTYRIMVLGGSNVYGDGIDNEADTFPEVLATLANQHTTGVKFEAINAGIPGYNSFQLRVFYEYFGSQFKHDLLIVYVGRNDVDSYDGIYTFREMWEMARNPKGRAVKAAQRFLRKSAIYNGLTNSVVEFRQTAAPAMNNEKLLKKTLPPEDFADNLTHIIGVAKSNGVTVVLANEFWGEPFVYLGEELVKKYQAQMAEVSKQKQIPLCDVYGIMAKNYELFDVVFRDDLVHINHHGHEEVGRLLFEFLTENRLIPATTGAN